ncbi:MAG: S-adenosylmethionine:tRNA ribosyltransferase-isomerase, partial [Acidimicrobiia bacterium]|nr:S-adenosylmethionine:tRNA ribosyltransferase-isomerase [Acidimicrobiia bacterium]
MDLADFSYELPRSAIAQHPASPRDSARLLELDGLRDHVFSDLPTLLSPGDLLVVNRTRVRASRLRGSRGTGGSAELLLLQDLGEERSIWSALVRPAKKLAVGDSIVAGRIVATVLEHHGEGLATVLVEADGDVEEAIALSGEMPLPPYISERLSDPGDYQTVYADETGSAAAPTAGLHFTPELMDRLGSAGIDVASVLLEVGLDTFRPITESRIEDHRIHS